MATVNKDFKIKQGLIVEGTSGTINGHSILTEVDGDAYILGLIGGETLITSVDADDFTVTGGNLTIAAGSDIARDGDITTAINALDTDAIEEGSTNLYYTDGRARSAILPGVGVNLNTATGYIDVNLGTGLETDGSNNIQIDRGTVDGWYDASGTAQGIVDALDTDDIEEGATNQYYTDARARGAVSAGDGLNYDINTGAFTAHLGNGLEISGGAIRIDDGIVATETDLTNAINAHDVATGVHGLTGNVVGTTDAQTLSNKTLGGDLAAGGFQITNLGAPNNSTDAATKAYVDAVSEGLHVHQAARAAILTNVAIATALENGDTAGGVTLATGDRILLNGQTTTSENGIYVVQASGQALRATDFDTATEVDSGDFIFVTSGTYANTGWVQTLKPATIGTDPISFTQFSGAGTFTAGNGLTLDGTVFEINESITATRTYVDGEIDAHTNLTSAHGTTGDVVGTSDSQTLTNKTLGSGTVLSANIDAANTYTVANLEEPVNNQDAATKFYVDGAISTVSTSIDNLNTDDVPEIANATNQYFTDARAKESAVDLLTNANLTNIQIQSMSGQLYITAENGVDDSTTDDLDEGINNVYFTDGRAQNAAFGLQTTFADIIANANKTNITASYSNMTGLTLTAENGVGDSTTDDLDEGSTNLYFTDQRAIDALQDTTPNFTAIEIDSIAKQVAATTGLVATASTVTAYAFPKATYRSAKFLVKTAYGTHTEVAEVILTLDTSDNIAITEYAIVGTNGSSMTISADVSGTDVRLRVTTINNNSTVNVVGTLLA